MSRRGSGRTGGATAHLLGLAAAATVAIAVSTARADTPPSSWDLARDPAAGDRWALHVRVERLLYGPEPDDSVELELRRDDELRLTAARTLLEEADATHSPDVRLRFDLGSVYWRLATLTGRSDFEQKVVEVLVPALELAPDDPAATLALDTLAMAYSELDRPHEELDAWHRDLARLTTARERVRPLMNMGEAEMHLGLLDDALRTFREGLQLCETLPNAAGVNETYALTLWDLALALDRSGDPALSLSTAAKARLWTWIEPVTRGLIQGNATVTGWDAIRDTSGEVSFSPEWEREWYLALGFASAGASATDPRDAGRMWGKAEQHWSSYVKRASAATAQPDRWLPIARTRLSHAHAARVEAERRAASLPTHRAAGEATWPDD